MTRYQLYPMIHWRTVQNDQNRAVFRPSSRTVSRRMMWTVVAGIMMLGLYIAIGRRLDSAPEPGSLAPTTAAIPPELEQMATGMEADLRDRLTDEEWQQFQEERTAKQRDREAQRDEFGGMLDNLGRVARGAYWIIMGTLAISGLYGPISAFWQQIAISRDPRGNLVVVSRGLIPQRHKWPRGVFQGIATRAEQQVHRQRYGIYRPAGWRWQVALVPRDGVETLAEFWIDYEDERIPSDTSVPDNVLHFVQTLKQITGLPAREPTFVAFQGVKPGRLSSGLRFSRRGANARGPVMTSHVTYGSLDEIPHHLRPKAEAMIAEARAKAGAKGWAHGSYESSTFQVTGQDGVTHTYASLEEMPPDIRAHFEQAMRERRK